ncbi:MAG TPA: TetR/AcrR family transcriptional regulator [Tissierellia bacterium]|jgi:TetR/AcrR family transcriptional regulator|nr:TetR/AcrR family transcriptional regulator [Tissierellia bacterium]
MYKKLDDNTINTILETGIDEFANKGLDRANINVIAKKSGVSVGVIYKYYKNKDSFFLACVRHSLKLLEQVLNDAFSDDADVMTCIRRIVYALLEHSRKHKNYNVMYNEITSGSCKRFAAVLAKEIETRTAPVYEQLMEKSKQSKDVKIDSRMLAFFFDNLLMMLQFSYSCDYYRERMKIYCGENIMDNDEKVAEEFIRFIGGVLGYQL